MFDLLAALFLICAALAILGSFADARRRQPRAPSRRQMATMTRTARFTVLLSTEWGFVASALVTILIVGTILILGSLAS